MLAFFFRDTRLVRNNLARKLLIRMKLELDLTPSLMKSTPQSLLRYYLFCICLLFDLVRVILEIIYIYILKLLIKFRVKIKIYTYLLSTVEIYLQKYMYIMVVRMYLSRRVSHLTLSKTKTSLSEVIETINLSTLFLFILE